MSLIGIDARWLKNYYTGIGKYTLGWLSGLAALNRPSEYVLFVDSDLNGPISSKYPLPEVEHFRLVPLGPCPHAAMPLQLKMLIQDQWTLPLAARATDCHLLFFPYFNPPLYGLRRSIVTITDLDLYLHPRSYSLHRRAYYNTLLRLASRFALAFVAISKATKSDAVRALGIPPERIHVVYPAIGEHFQPIDRDQAIGWCAEHYGVVRPFVLYTGGFSERKNVPRLIQAFVRSSESLDRQYCLVLTGNPRGYPVVEKAIREAPPDRIVLTGVVPEAHMPHLYSAATVLVYPSLYEGFGMPIVEAQACGTPVVISNVSSMPEVAGGACILVDPTSVDSIAAGIISGISDATLRKELVRAGLQNVRRFSWRQGAEQLSSLFFEVGEKLNR